MRAGNNKDPSSPSWKEDLRLPNERHGKVPQSEDLLVIPVAFRLDFKVFLFFLSSHTIFPLSFLAIKFSRLVREKMQRPHLFGMMTPQLYRRTQTTVDRRLFGELPGQPPAWLCSACKLFVLCSFCSGLAGSGKLLQFWFKWKCCFFHSSHQSFMQVTDSAVNGWI